MRPDELTTPPPPPPPLRAPRLRPGAPGASGRAEPHGDDSRPPARRVLDYRDAAADNTNRARRRWVELRDLFQGVEPGCLVVAAVVMILLVYAMIAVAVLSSPS